MGQTGRGVLRPAGAASIGRGQVELAGAAGNPVRWRIDISHSFSRRYWPILPASKKGPPTPALCRAVPRTRHLLDVRVIAEGAAPASGARVPAAGRTLGRAPSHSQNLEHVSSATMVVERIGARDEMARALEQILQAQQGPDALVERILVRDDGQTSLAEGENARILSDLAAQHKLTSSRSQARGRLCAV